MTVKGVGNFFRVWSKVKGQKNGKDVFLFFKILVFPNSCKYLVLFSFLTIEEVNTDLVMKDVGKVESYRDPRESMILSH